jgi:hypothetical protein
VKAAQSFDPYKITEAIQGDNFWQQRMYTQIVADLYPG